MVYKRYFISLWEAMNGMNKKLEETGLRKKIGDKR
jgi:hypothetical protein